MISYLRTALAGLWADRRGNVLMITAFALIPIMFATGMAIDYSRAGRLQTKLTAAADAAALSATTKPMLNMPLMAGCNASRRTFLNALQQYSSGLVFSADTNLTISITEIYPNNSTTTQTCPKVDGVVPTMTTLPVTRTVTVTYSGNSTNAFGGILGRSALPIGGVATARASIGSYYQIVFLVDVSNSMAIGGSASAISSLVNDKTIKCSFACHDPNGLMAVEATTYCNSTPLDASCRSQGPMYCPSGTGKCQTIKPSPTYSDRRGLAKLYGIKLKIDFVRDALTSFMTKLQPKMIQRPNNYNVGVYTFGSQFVEKQALTSDPASVQTALNAVEVEVANRYIPQYANQGWTFTSSGLQSALNKISNVGDGSTPTQRMTYLIFVSDGVEDDVGTVIYNRGTYYNYIQKCKAAKDAGIMVFSIETAYPSVTDDGDGQYRQLITNLPSRNNGMQIADAMKSCASSPSQYFIASDGIGIQNAVDNVFSAIDADTSRLTQ